MFRWRSSSRCGRASSRRCSGNAQRIPTRGRGPSRAATSTLTRRSSSRSAGTSPGRSTFASCRTSSSSRRGATHIRHPKEWQLATAYLGIVPLGVDPALPEDTNWHSVDRLPALAFDHRAITLAGRDRLRAKLSYTNIGFALAPRTFTLSELRDIYAAALGHDVSATNLQRVLVRRGVLEATGKRREPGRAGGRPAALFRFSTPKLEVTDQFAVLRPPER